MPISGVELTTSHSSRPITDFPQVLPRNWSLPDLTDGKALTIHLPPWCHTALHHPLLRTWLQQRGISPYNLYRFNSIPKFPQLALQQIQQHCHRHRWAIGLALAAWGQNTLLERQPHLQHQLPWSLLQSASQFNQWTSFMLIGACFGIPSRSSPAAAWRNHLLGLHIEQAVQMVLQQRHSFLVWLGKVSCDGLQIDQTLQSMWLERIPLWLFPLAYAIEQPTMSCSMILCAVGIGMVMTSWLDRFQFAHTSFYPTTA